MPVLFIRYVAIEARLWPNESAPLQNILEAFLNCFRSKVELGLTQRAFDFGKNLRRDYQFVTPQPCFPLFLGTAGRRVRRHENVRINDELEFLHAKGGWSNCLIVFNRSARGTVTWPALPAFLNSSRSWIPDRASIPARRSLTETLPAFNSSSPKMTAMGICLAFAMDS